MIEQQKIPDEFDIKTLDILALCRQWFSQEKECVSFPNLDLPEEDINMIFRYAKHLLMTDRFETAEQWFQLLATLVPFDINYKLKLAYCQYQEKKYQEALMNCYQVSFLDMTNVEASYQAACCLEALGQNQNALNAYKACLSFLLLSSDPKKAQLSKTISEKINKLTI